MLALSIKNLYKTYANGVVAVRGVDLAVEEGEFFALLGHNGAGKTTIIGIVSSLVNKTSGDVSVFGHDLTNEPTKAKECIGLVPQEINFNQFEKVIDIVISQAGYYGIPRLQASERAEKYLTQLHLWGKRNEIARNLSGGMKRRLMIARALIHEPRMLILDEPTAGVDIEIRRSTWDFLQRINQNGTTIILTTHYLEEAEHLCHSIGIIDKGRIIERTLMKDLLAQLPSETIILDLQQPCSLQDLPTMENVEFKLFDSKTLEITFNRTKTLNNLFNELSEHGLHVSSMRNKNNRLEELFLSKTQQARPEEKM